MNRERILALADLIEEQPHTDEEADEGFTMESITHDCGTPACIAGWAAWEALGRQRGDLYSIHTDLDAKAREFLDIDPLKAEDLFYPPFPIVYATVTPSEAAATLRHLAETGEVDWSVKP
jgi:hypothetical protein